MASRSLEQKTNRKLILGKNSIRTLDEFLVRKTNACLVVKHFISAEHSELEKLKRQDIYNGFLANSYCEPDLRTFKQRLAYCPDQSCHYSQGFQTKVQKEVDVAIAMRPIQCFMQDQSLTGVVLLAGDGDFFDMVHTVICEFNRKVYLCGWSASMSPKLIQLCQPNIIYLDEIWDQLTFCPKPTVQ